MWVHSEVHGRIGSIFSVESSRVSPIWDWHGLARNGDPNIAVVRGKSGEVQPTWCPSLGDWDFGTSCCEICPFCSAKLLCPLVRSIGFLRKFAPNPFVFEGQSRFPMFPTNPLRTIFGCLQSVWISTAASNKMCFFSGLSGARNLPLLVGSMGSWQFRFSCLIYSIIVTFGHLDTFGLIRKVIRKRLTWKTVAWRLPVFSECHPTGYGDEFLDHTVAGHVFRPQPVACSAEPMDFPIVTTSDCATDSRDIFWTCSLDTLAKHWLLMFVFHDVITLVCKDITTLRHLTLAHVSNGYMIYIYIYYINM